MTNSTATKQPETHETDRADGADGALTELLTRLLDETGPGTGLAVEIVDDTLVQFGTGDQATRLHRDAARAALDRLVALGEAAGRTRATWREQERARDTEQTQTRREAVQRRHQNADASLYGLTPAGADDSTDSTDGGWRLPGPDAVAARVRVRPVAELPTPGWGGLRAAAMLEVSYDGTVIGTVTVDVDEKVTTAGAYATRLMPEELAGSRRCHELVNARPWGEFTSPGPDASVLAHVKALAAFGDQVLEWVRAAEQLFADAEAEEHRRAEEATEWARDSRSKARIPSAALNRWMKDHSHVDYHSNGLPSSGWRVAAEPIVTRTRPAHLDPTRRRKSGVGVKELQYAIRLVHVDAINPRQKKDFLTFHERDVNELREALPGCVVKVPEDRKAVFVAYDAEPYVTELDAALVEWIFTQGND